MQIISNRNSGVRVFPTISAVTHFIFSLNSIITLVSCLMMDIHSTFALKEIYWNKTNPLFRGTNDDTNILDVSLHERVRVVCPYYPVGGDMEHYIIYRVPKHHYDDCNLPNFTHETELSSLGIEWIYNCSQPAIPISFSLYITPFSALPPSWGGSDFTYESGHTYYFTTISTGSRFGLLNRDPDQSACRKYNLRTKIRVCCNHNDTECETGATLCSSLESDNFTSAAPQREIGGESANTSASESNTELNSLTGLLKAQTTTSTNQNTPTSAPNSQDAENLSSSLTPSTVIFSLCLLVLCKTKL